MILGILTPMLGKWGARALLIAVAVALVFAIKQGISYVKDQYDTSLITDVTQKAKIEQLEQRETDLLESVAKSQEAVKNSNELRQKASNEATKARQMLRSRVKEVIQLQAKVKELELLADKRITQPKTFEGPTLNGGERKVAPDFPKEEPIDFASVEFNGALRLFHDQALSACTSPELAVASFGITGGLNQAPLTIQEFVETVVENYCTATEIKRQLIRAQAWASENCLYKPEEKEVKKD